MLHDCLEPSEHSSRFLASDGIRQRVRSQFSIFLSSLKFGVSCTGSAPCRAFSVYFFGILGVPSAATRIAWTELQKNFARLRRSPEIACGRSSQSTPQFLRNWPSFEAQKFLWPRWNLWDPVGQLHCLDCLRLKTLF